MPGLRYSVSAVTGTVVAIFMLWLMQLLVTSPAKRLPTTEPSQLIEFVRLKREEKLHLKERVPPPPPAEKSTPPPRPRLDLQREPQAPAPHLDISTNLNVPLAFGDGPYLGPPADLQAESGFIPLSRQPPQYPYKAARRGIEGWVRVAFEVTETGNVDHVEVIASDPPGVFDNAAIRAVSRWRFKPRIVNGKAVSGKASQVVEFRLNKEQ